MTNTISVLIVTWNSESYIGSCLQSLVSSEGRPLEIIVIDNCSVDGTAEIVRGYSRVELIATETNLGFAPAMNIALRRAQGRFLCMLNPDTEVSPTALDHLADVLEQNALAAAVGPSLLDDKGEVLPTSARSLPSLWECFARQFGLAKAFPTLLPQGHVTRRRFVGHPPVSVPAISGATLMLRRSVFEETGPLDETIPMYFEDLDYCARLCRKGHVCWVPEAVVFHSGAKSADAAPARKLLYAMEDGEAPFLFFKRYRSNISARLFVFITLFGSMFRVCLLFPVFCVARFGGLRIGTKFQGTLSKAAALLWWSISPTRCVQARIREFFGRTDRSQLERSSLLPKESTEGAS